MNSKERIDVWISPEGAITLDAVGYTGSSCEEATRFLSDLSQGMAPATMDITRNDELGMLLQVMETWNTRAGFDPAEAKRVSDEMTRIKIALDGAATAVMIADP